MSDKAQARDEHMKSLISRKVVKTLIEKPVKNFFRTKNLQNKDNFS
jgi:hypothetical protein